MKPTLPWARSNTLKAKTLGDRRRMIYDRVSFFSGFWCWRMVMFRLPGCYCTSRQHRQADGTGYICLRLGYHRSGSPGYIILYIILDPLFKPFCISYITYFGFWIPLGSGFLGTPGSRVSGLSPYRKGAHKIWVAVRDFNLTYDRV